MTEQQAERLVIAIEQLCEHMSTIAHANAVILSAMTEPEATDETPAPMQTLDGKPSADLSRQYDLARAD